MISADPYRIAREVIGAANTRGLTIDAVLHERFPIGSGGVGHARSALHREIKQRIAEWLEPGEPAERGLSQ